MEHCTALGEASCQPACYTPCPFIPPYSPKCLEQLPEKPYERAKCLTIKRLMAT
jgi:hypothetical protein